MRGGSPLGRWEVKDCSNFKAMSLCKMPVKTWDKIELERRWPFRKCYADWESKSGLASCFKVMSKLCAYSFGPCIPILFSKISFLQVPGIITTYCLSLLMFIFQIILNTKKEKRWQMSPVSLKAEIPHISIEPKEKDPMHWPSALGKDSKCLTSP